MVSPQSIVSSSRSAAAGFSGYPAAPQIPKYRPAAPIPQWPGRETKNPALPRTGGGNPAALPNSHIPSRSTPNPRRYYDYTRSHFFNFEEIINPFRIRIQMLILFYAWDVPSNDSCSRNSELYLRRANRFGPKLDYFPVNGLISSGNIPNVADRRAYHWSTVSDPYLPKLAGSGR